jgi:hypothetical protein
MTNPENGIAYIDPVYVAVRWCNRNPQWFSHDLDHKDEFAIIEAAINGELPAT